jgi:hypothetical protein
MKIQKQQKLLKWRFGQEPIQEFIFGGLKDGWFVNTVIPEKYSGDGNLLIATVVFQRDEIPDRLIIKDAKLWWENLPLMSHTSPCKFLLFEEHLNTDGRYSHEAMDSEILDIYKIEVLNEK